MKPFFLSLIILSSHSAFAKTEITLKEIRGKGRPVCRVFDTGIGICDYNTMKECKADISEPDSESCLFKVKGGSERKSPIALKAAKGSKDYCRVSANGVGTCSYEDEEACEHSIKEGSDQECLPNQLKEPVKEAVDGNTSDYDDPSKKKPDFVEKFSKALKQTQFSAMKPFFASKVELIERAYKPVTGGCEAYERKTVLSTVNDLEKAEKRVKNNLADQQLVDFENNEFGIASEGDCEHVTSVTFSGSTQKIMRITVDAEQNEWSPKMKDFKLK